MAREQKVADTDVFGGAAEPAAPPVDTITVSRDDLQKMVAAQVAAALTAVAPADDGKGHLSDMKALFDQMAMSFAQMSHQGDRTYKPVDPKEIAAREVGRQKLEAVLDRVARARKEANEASYTSEEARIAAIKAATPYYRVISFCCLDDDLIAPAMWDSAAKMSQPVRVHYALEPNDAMLPLNEIAEEVHAAFRESRGKRSATERKSIKPSWTTRSGLVIEGGAAPRRRELAMPVVLRDVDQAAPIARQDHTQVLGTLHPPFERQHIGDRPAEIEGRYTR